MPYKRYLVTAKLRGDTFEFELTALDRPSAEANAKVAAAAMFDLPDVPWAAQPLIDVRRKPENLVDLVDNIWRGKEGD